MLVSKKAITTFYIDGIEIDPPLEWQGISILATAKDGSAQANITQTSFTFVRNAYKYLSEHLEAGKHFIMPSLKIRIQNESNVNEYEYVIDMTKCYVDDYVTFSIKAPIKELDGINNLTDEIDGITYGFLEALKFFKTSSYKTIDYVVEPPDNGLKIVMLSIIETQMILQLISSSAQLSRDVKEASLFFTLSVPSPQTSALAVIANAIISATVTAATLVQVIVLGKNLINAFALPKRQAKACTIHNLIQGVADYLGYSFETGYTDLENEVYLPSNLEFDEIGLDGLVYRVHGTTSGIPNTTDYGYGLTEMFDTIKQYKNGAFALVDGVLHFAKVDSDYWYNQSDFVFPDVQLIGKEFNAKDFKTNKLLQCQTDASDLWTTEEYTGTVIENITSQSASIERKYDALKGLQRIQLPLSLGTKKNKLNPFEKSLANLANLIDGIIDTFGGKGDLQSKILDKVNLLKISTNTYQNPKILKYSGSKLKSKSEFSTVTMWNDNYNLLSFVENDGIGQKIEYNNLQNVPIGYNDFVKLRKNPYFYMLDGRKAKMKECNWLEDSDTSNCKIEIQEKYALGLKEINIIP